jgi:hypothetical protein
MHSVLEHYHAILAMLYERTLSKLSDDSKPAFSDRTAPQTMLRCAL